MATLSEVQDGIARVLKMVGRPLVEGYASEAAQPSSAYLMYYLSETGTDERVSRSIDDDGQEVVTVQAFPLFGVELVGGNAEEDAITAQMLFGSMKRYDDLWKICGLMELTNPVDRTALEVGTMRARFHFDIRVATSFVRRTPVEPMESVCITVIEPSLSFENEYCGLPPGVCETPQDVRSNP